MFCVKCGKEAKAGNFCEECFIERSELFDIKGFVIIKCDSCGKIDRFSDLKEAVMSRIKSPHSIPKCEITERQIGNKIHTTVRCTGIIKPLKTPITKEKKIEIIVRRKKCENCIRLSGGYYEAAFQVRGDNQESILSIIKENLPEPMLTDILKLKEGYDVRIVDKRVASRIARSLAEDFSVKKSFKLIAEKKGKKLYRDFYAVR